MMSGDEINSVHLIGICGTGMGALAGLLKTEGYHVTGSDANVYPPKSTQLAKMGIDVLNGYDPSHISHNPDLVIVGNVIRKENPEARAAIDGGMEYLSFPGALYRFYLSKKNSIAICGTHGKTTTTALVSHLFNNSGLDPSFLVGGVAKNIGTGFRIGKGEDFIIEGDEYDTAFFDKVPKFIRYKPDWAVMANIEFDHGDIYENLDQVIDVFTGLKDIIPGNGLLFAGIDCPNVLKVIKGYMGKIITFGISESADYHCKKWAVKNGRMFFDLYEKGKLLGKLASPIVGEHNLKNLLCAIAISRKRGMGFSAIKEGLKCFEGIKRRQEVIGEVGGITIIDDFAHHPTAVRLTLEGIKLQYRNRRIIALFEPRTNTTRKNYFQDEYAKSFGAADMAFIAPVFNIDQIEEGLRFDPKKLARDISATGIECRHFGSYDSLLNSLLKVLVSNDVVVLMSNGGFGGLNNKILLELKDKLLYG